MINVGGNNTIFKVGSSDCSIYLGDIKLYPTGEHDYSQDYFTVVSESNNNLISIIHRSLAPNVTVSASTDGGATWSEGINYGDVATLNRGDKLLLKGVNNSFANNVSANTILSTSSFHVEGNIMSLLYGDSFTGQTSLANRDYAFTNLFYGATNLTNAENLVLPATTLSDSCYRSMFNGCSGLIASPELPATTLTNNCYQYMFHGCSGLTTAPELPATTLAPQCYYYMFHNCAGLTTPPSSIGDSSTTMAASACTNMFEGCESLTTAPALPARTLANKCYHDMFYLCSGLTIAPELPATTLADNCYEYMFCDCTSLTTAPALSATTLDDFCYNGMFQGCTSLTTAPALPATTLSPRCYSFMFQGCTGLTTAPELSAATLDYKCYEEMFSGCSSLNYIKCLATDISATDCTYNWVNGVATAGTFVKSASMESWTTGVNGIPTNWTVQNEGGHDYSQDYFTIVSEADDNLISIVHQSLAPNVTVSASTDGGVTWSEGINDGDVATLNTGDKLLIKGVNNTWANSTTYNYISGAKDFHVEGNIMSLLYGDSFTGQTSLANRDYAFCNLFEGTSNLTNAENLVLPATTLSNHCYGFMFNGCSGLTASPELPATALSDYCYQAMFQHCKSLHAAPALPATTLASNCYEGMFGGSSLTTAPALPATTLADKCYQNMFVGTRLTTAPALPATTLATRCYGGMFSSCTSLTTVPNDMLPATTLASNCYEGMFGGSSLTTAPALPATTLADKCYQNMFSGCTRLTTAPALPATTLSPSGYNFMFCNCTSLTTAPALPATTLTARCYEGMFSGCTSLNYIKCLATNISASNCTSYWVNGVATAGTFVKSASMTSWSTGVDGIPSGWDVLVDGQENYFTIVSEANNNRISIVKGSGAPSITVSASTDDGSTWSTYSSGNIATLNTGDKLLLKGVNNAWGNSTTQNSISGAKDFHVEGNIMSLLYGDNFTGQTSFNSIYVFKSLFAGVISLTSAENLVLPATTLTDFCYWAMFQGCTNLSSAPVLPATTLADNCYRNMLFNCTSLTTAPALPATTLVNGCYRSMFYGCSGLTASPDLSVTTLVTDCYRYMFSGCTNLNYIKCLATDISATDCTLDWVNGVAASGTFVKDPNMSDWTTGNNGIPVDWTVQGGGDYSQNYFTIVSEANNNTISIVKGSGAPSITVSASTDDGSTWSTYSSGNIATLNTGDKLLLKGVNNTWASTKGNSISGTSSFHVEGNIMSLLYGDNFTGQTSFNSSYVFKSLFDKDINLTSAENLVLPATTLSEGCYRGMFSGCTRLTTAPALPATTLRDYCYHSMFRGCTGLTTAPELPATTLTNYCYQLMFSGCTSLNYIKCLTTNISASNCTANWVSGVAASGTFVKDPNMTSWTTGSSGIPTNWTVQDAT